MKLSFERTIFLLCVFCAATAIASPAQASCSAAAPCFTSLVTFDHTNGGNPDAVSLVQGLDGNFYGTTGGGGIVTCAPSPGVGCGTVFKISAGGTLTTLYSFCPQTGCTDGYSPYAGLVQGTNGNFYGTTVFGGANGTNAGTVFKLSPEPSSGCPSGSNTGNGWCETVLYSFCSKTNCTDGGNPYAVLVQGTDGNFYGTNANGGAHSDGTVFKITVSPSVTLTTLYSFCSKTSCTDGSLPLAGLVQATDGNLYGTTLTGGAHNGGTVFKVTPGGTLTTLHSFDITDGANPYAGLVQATDGNFYGTTFTGGTGGNGTVFKITATPSVTLTTLHNFCSPTCIDGSNPVGGLVQGTDGNFYGSTNMNGAGSVGTVFSLSVGLGPFVETDPTSGKVGTRVIILGNNLTGSTSVTFNGTKATFTVNSTGTAITTTVPSGATTGKVKVTTPGPHTLTSNVNFRVTPTISSFSPTSGPPGTSVTINGESFTGATSVTFGGVKATSFTVNSYTKITATVPSAAKTGKITVTTPGGTATSSGTFTVT